MCDPSFILHLKNGYIVCYLLSLAVNNICVYVVELSWARQ